MHGRGLGRGAPGAAPRARRSSGTGSEHFHLLFVTVS